MQTAAEWVAALNLTPHVEGGYYRQVLKSADALTLADGRERAQYTSIYFLLEAANPSRFHRLTSDEVWYFHYGEPLTVHLLLEDGRYETLRLGHAVEQGQMLQALVPKGTIFGSTVEQGFAVVSCMVAPGFEYEDFELMGRQQLLTRYPQHATLIKRLTR